MGKQSTFVSTVQKGKKPEGLGVQGQREPGGGQQRAGRECFGPSCAPVLHCQELGICKTWGQLTVRRKVVDLSTCSCPDK